MRRALPSGVLESYMRSKRARLDDADVDELAFWIALDLLVSCREAEADDDVVDGGSATEDGE